MKRSKNIVITGASTGIGYGMAKSMTNKGYKVFGSVRKQADADRLKKELGDNFEPLFFDVTNAAKVYEEAERLTQLIGSEGLAGLVNNAGIAVAGPAMHIPLEDWKHQFDVNVFGLITTTQAFLPLLGAQKDCPYAPGRILNVSSVNGKLTSPFMGAYAGSKHAVEAISEAFRVELQLYGIEVIVIGPGVVKTPIWKKADDIDLSKWDNTDYAEAAGKLMKFIKKMSTKGYSEEEFGDKMLQILENPKPKVRYALVKNKWQNWTLPRLLPTRIINKIIAKRLGFIKK